MTATTTIIKPGDIILLHCQHHGEQAPHLYGGWPPLICLQCHPDKAPKDSNPEPKPMEVY